MAVEMRRVSKSYGARRVLEGVSFRFPEGGITALAGPSGVGKTTLLRLVLGLEAPDAGEVCGARQLSQAAVFQEDRLFEDLSAEKNIRLVCGAPRAEIEAHLARVGLAGEADTRVSHLSGGMKRRVAVVRAALARAQLLVMDEPFKGLDAGTKAAVLSYVREMAAGRTAIVVTHGEADADALGAAACLRLGGG